MTSDPPPGAHPIVLRDLIVGLEPADPDRAYARWAEHVEVCPRCAGAGELDPEHLCSRGQLLLRTWLASEPAPRTAPGPRSKSFVDQVRINSEVAPA